MCMYVRMHLCIYMYLCICLCVCMYIRMLLPVPVARWSGKKVHCLEWWGDSGWRCSVQPACVYICMFVTLALHGVTQDGDATYKLHVCVYVCTHVCIACICVYICMFVTLASHQWEWRGDSGRRRNVQAACVRVCIYIHSLHMCFIYVCLWLWLYINGSDRVTICGDATSNQHMCIYIYICMWLWLYRLTQDYDENRSMHACMCWRMYARDWRILIGLEWCEWACRCNRCNRRLVACTYVYNVRTKTVIENNKAHFVCVSGGHICYSRSQSRFSWEVKLWA
jgi:hypothetical protein